jgi:hypothetical protein
MMRISFMQSPRQNPKTKRREKPLSIFIVPAFGRIEKLVMRNITETEISTVLNCTAWTIAAVVKFRSEMAQIIVDDDINYEKPHNTTASLFIENTLSTPWDVRGDALVLTGADMLS